MIAGTIGTNSCGDRNILFLINIYPVVGIKVHGLISGTLIVKNARCAKVSISFTLEAENID